MDGINDLKLGNDLMMVPTQPADVAQLARVHSSDYLDDLQRFCSTGRVPSRRTPLLRQSRGTRPAGRQEPGWWP